MIYLATIKAAQENETEIENSKSFLNKYTVDYNRLYKFLSNEDNFKLQNLLAFFRKTEDSQPMLLNKPEFQIFTTTNKNKMSQEELRAQRQL